MKRFVDRLLLIALVLVVLVLTATSISTLWGGSLGGSTLLTHLTAGGGLVIGMPFVALWFLRSAVIRRATWPTQLGYWLTLLAATATIATVFLCMLPLPSTEQMNELMELHRYAGFAMLPAVALFVLTTARSRRMESIRSTTPG